MTMSFTLLLLQGMSKELIHYHPELLTQGDDSGCTPLHKAVCFDDPSLVELLVRSDASPAYTLNQDCLSLVHVAAGQGQFGAFQLLMRLCPESCLVSTDKGMNMLHLSVQISKMAIVETVLENSMLAELINDADNKGNTPVDIANLNGDDEMCTTICRHGEVQLQSVRNHQVLTEPDSVDKVKQVSISNPHYNRFLGVDMQEGLMNLFGFYE